jgi:hypothetical protein
MAQYLLSPQATKETKKAVRDMSKEKEKVATSKHEKERLQSMIVDI